MMCGTSNRSGSCYVYPDEGRHDGGSLLSTAPQDDPQASVAAGADVVCVSGRLDASSAPVVREQIRTAVESGTADIVVDLGLVEWIDATGLAVLVAAHRRLRTQDRRLVLRGCRPGVRRALAVTRLNRVLMLEPPLGVL